MFKLANTLLTVRDFVERSYSRSLLRMSEYEALDDKFTSFPIFKIFKGLFCSTVVKVEKFSVSSHLHVFKLCSLCNLQFCKILTVQISHENFCWKCPIFPLADFFTQTLWLEADFFQEIVFLNTVSQRCWSARARPSRNLYGLGSI